MALVRAGAGAGGQCGAGVRILAICHRVTTAAAAALIADHKAISAGPGQVLGGNVLPHLLAAAQTQLLASLD